MYPTPTLHAPPLIHGSSPLRPHLPLPAQPPTLASRFCPKHLAPPLLRQVQLLDLGRSYVSHLVALYEREEKREEGEVKVYMPRRGVVERIRKGKGGRTLRELQDGALRGSLARREVREEGRVLRVLHWEGDVSGAVGESCVERRGADLVSPPALQFSFPTPRSPSSSSSRTTAPSCACPFRGPLGLYLSTGPLPIDFPPFPHKGKPTPTSKRPYQPLHHSRSALLLAHKPHHEHDAACRAIRQRARQEARLREKREEGLRDWLRMDIARSIEGSGGELQLQVGWALPSASAASTSEDARATSFRVLGGEPAALRSSREELRRGSKSRKRSKEGKSTGRPTSNLAHQAVLATGGAPQIEMKWDWESERGVDWMVEQPDDDEEDEPEPEPEQPGAQQLQPLSDVEAHVVLSNLDGALAGMPTTQQLYDTASGRKRVRSWMGALARGGGAAEGEKGSCSYVWKSKSRKRPEAELHRGEAIVV